MIEIRLLSYFLAIAREQSITKAADALHITQPTLSKQMMELEAQLGKQLLIRGKKKITLTEEGAYLRSKAQEMINLMEKTESAFHTDEELISGDIYMGCGETPAMEFITGIFKGIQNDYPHVHFHIFSGDAEAVMERLDKGLLDLGLLLGPMQHEKYDYLNLARSDSYGLLMRETVRLRRRRPYPLTIYRGFRLLLPHRPTAAASALSCLGKYLTR